MLILLVWNNTLPLNYEQFVRIAAACICGLQTPPERPNFIPQVQVKFTQLPYTATCPAPAP